MTQVTYLEQLRARGKKGNYRITTLKELCHLRHSRPMFGPVWATETLSPAPRRDASETPKNGEHFLNREVSSANFIRKNGLNGSFFNLILTQEAKKRRQTRLADDYRTLGGLVRLQASTGAPKAYDGVLPKAVEYKLRAERKLGEILEEGPRNKGTAGLGRPRLGGTYKELPKNIPTLSSLGLTKKVSSRSRRLADHGFRPYDHLPRRRGAFLVREITIGHAHEIKICALRKLGEILREWPKAKGAIGSPGPGRGKRGIRQEPRFNSPLTLADLGLDKKTSSLSQRLASITERQIGEIARR